MDTVEVKLKEMLAIAGLHVCPSYRPREVCKILGISQRTFWRMTSQYERDPETEGPVQPDTLDSFMIRKQRRVRFGELVEYLRRNNTYDRINADKSV